MTEIDVSEGVVVLRAPRVNANDEEVLLTRWLVQDGSLVHQGQAVAEIETSKVAAEVEATADGILVHGVVERATLLVGQQMALIGRDAEAIAAWRTQAHDAATVANGAVKASDKARALATRYDVDLTEVAADVTARTIKEQDVWRFLQARGIGGAEASPAAKAPAAATLPADVFLAEGQTTPHQNAVAANLRQALAGGIFTTMQFNLHLDGAAGVMAQSLANGRNISLLHLVLHALARTLPEFPLMTTVVAGGQMLRHRTNHLAFVARSLDGRLFTPVVRSPEDKNLADIARECARLSKRAMKGALDAGDMGAAAFTVSMIPHPQVSAFTALPAPGQAAILAVGGEWQQLSLVAGAVQARRVATATLTYDHTLMDGIYASQFLARFNENLGMEGRAA